MKVSVYTIGCKVNQYESDSLINALTNRGYEVTDSLESADAYIINTCAVTNEAERKSRQCVSRARHLNANANIYIIGCASERNTEQFKCREGVKFISGTAKKDRLEQFEKLEGIVVDELPNDYEDKFKPLSLRARYYIKVQDGCNNFCSYCVLPYLRGRSRSRAIDSIIDEIKSTDTNEIVLTGINLSAYGKDINSNLTQLLKAVKGLSKRLRLGSLEVRVIDDDLLGMLKSMTEFCPQFHLSLQSGDDDVLRNMNRHYTREEFYEKTKLIREYFPDCAITTDIIVGFPSEDDKAFNNTLDLARRVQFPDMHIFPYSPRSGTKAYVYGRIDKIIVKSRIDALDDLRAVLHRSYIEKFINTNLEVLFETYAYGLYQGYSRNYIKVYSKNKYELKKISNVNATALYKDGLIV